MLQKIVPAVLLWALLGIGSAKAAVLTPVAPSQWDETAVRKVLQVFAYGGFVTDAQVTAWAGMLPRNAIGEMLTFTPTNDRLSPLAPGDDPGLPPASVPLPVREYRGGQVEALAGGLRDLQEFWMSPDPLNPVREDKRALYDVVRPRTLPDGSVEYRPYAAGLQNTWLGAVTRRGLNPFLHKVAFWLLNYNMAISLKNADPPLIRGMYDDVLEALEQGRSYDEVLGTGAASAAIAFQYGHRNNVYLRNPGVFKVNDDFAREYHQLFFRILGVTEIDPLVPDYHEQVTIENTAKLLTGMKLDQIPGLWGATRRQDQWADFIDFSDHIDPAGTRRNNLSLHYQGDLEILHHVIPGQLGTQRTQAENRLFQLSQVAIEHPESLDNLPIYIIGSLADSHLTPDKVAAIRATWVTMQPKSLLALLREYAISTTFHRSDTYRYWTAFDRNLLLYNLNTVSNRDTFQNTFSPKGNMAAQGATIFVPAHAVFGGQTPLDAATNPNLFKTAYNAAVGNPNQVARTQQTFTDAAGNRTVWRKDWARLIPESSPGCYRVADVGAWLWNRFIADGGKNYKALERAYVTGFLARGMDLGYLLNPAAPVPDIRSDDLEREPFKALLTAMNGECMALAATQVAKNREANRRVGMAINFISLTPFMFALEGRSENTPPIADPGADRQAFVGSPTDLDATASIDAEGDYLTYAWTLGQVPAGSQAVIADAHAGRTALVPDLPGTYRVRLVVNDGAVNSDPVVLTLTALAAPALDTDGDGVPDARDLCTLIPNPAQVDGDGDGYGNACDADLNNDNAVNSLDIGAFRTAFLAADPKVDFNEDGAVNSLDIGGFRSAFLARAIGPSGLHP